MFLQRVSKFQPKCIPSHPSGQYSVYQGCINLRCQVTWVTKFVLWYLLSAGPQCEACFMSLSGA